MKQSRVQCPTCSVWLTGTRLIAGSGHGPHVGDVSLCIVCGEILEFTATLGIIPLRALESLDAGTRGILLSMQTEIRNKTIH